MTSSVISLLGADKLTRKNYATWENTINTVLVIDDLKFVLTKKYPPVPGPTASRNVREAYKKWTKANNKSMVYILASLIEVLAKKHESMITAREIMESLHEMFG
ncbi:uncharacterized protein LOC120083926 [Benincasa hispida]|uniref:uncharacterized protein LOC120083926 n=1 Tax=Benincasa hispida TaxID=102211 RepID=UPI0018FF433A|nr:uncharacterized protein LOC120083926 [Benincasa hispida]